VLRVCVVWREWWCGVVRCRSCFPLDLLILEGTEVRATTRLVRLWDLRFGVYALMRDRPTRMTFDLIEEQHFDTILQYNTTDLLVRLDSDSRKHFSPAMVVSAELNPVSVNHALILVATPTCFNCSSKH
jgi:hypothetical protein